MVCSRVGPRKEGVDQPVPGNGLLCSFLFYPDPYILEKLKIGFSCGVDMEKGGPQLSFGSRLFMLIWLKQLLAQETC